MELGTRMTGLTLLLRNPKAASHHQRVPLQFLMSSVALCALGTPALAQSTAPSIGPTVFYTLQDTGSNGGGGKNASGSDLCVDAPTDGDGGGTGGLVMASPSYSGSSSYNGTMVVASSTGGAGGTGGSGSTCGYAGRGGGAGGNGGEVQVVTNQPGNTYSFTSSGMVVWSQGGRGGNGGSTGSTE